jgi:ABC-type maltose transport system permease subunit
MNFSKDIYNIQALEDNWNGYNAKAISQVTFDNYKEVVTNTHFFIWLKNSAIICFSVAIIQLALSLPAGFAFSKLKFKFRS